MNELVLPIAGYVPAGFPSPAADYVEDVIDLNKYVFVRPSATFLFRCSGDSMKDVGIFSGTLLVVDRSISPKHSHIVVAVLNGELTVKRLIKTHGGVFLSPENSAYKPIHIKEGMEMSVWGVVTFIITDAMKV
jgi:DNA polymerase V